MVHQNLRYKSIEEIETHIRSIQDREKLDLFLFRLVLWEQRDSIAYKILEGNGKVIKEIAKLAKKAAKKEYLALFIYDFVDKKKPSLNNYGKFCCGAFTDDCFDQGLSTFFDLFSSDIELHCNGFPMEDEEFTEQDHERYEELERKYPEWFRDPDYPIDPNYELDHVISYRLQKEMSRWQKTLPLAEIYELFPKDFWNKAKNWITIQLNQLFLHRYRSHRDKFSSESIDKIIDAGAKYLIISGNPPFTWKVDQIMSHMESSFLLTHHINLTLLYLIFINELRGTTYHYHENIVYWLDPSVYIPKIKKLSEQKVFLDIIPKLLKPVPMKLISGDLTQKIIRYITEFTSFQKEFHEGVYQLFLHFAYYGLVDERIPGIKQGAYTFEQLEKDLDDLFECEIEYRK